MRTYSALLALVATLAVAGGASGATIGANEDDPLTNPSLYGQMAGVGLRQNVLSVKWTQGQGLSAAVKGVIGNAISTARAQGVSVVLAVYPAAGNAVKFADPANKPEFVAFVANVVRSFPQARSVIIGNEPNRTLFMNPVNPGLFAEILGDAYDAVKAVDAGVAVIGVGLSPRGTGDGRSLFPVQFVKGMGDWYRDSQRAKDGKPLMDGFSFHPYPFPEDKAPSTASDWPTIGMADLYRLKQALWDAFEGTPQKTVESGLALHLDEVAYQVPTDGKPGYAGAETVKTVDEVTQAAFYGQIVNQVACDASIASLSFFHFIDERARDRFQSGFVDANGGRRPVADAVKQALADTGGGSRCSGTATTWAHATGVLGAKEDFSKLRTSYPQTVSSFTVGLRVEEEAAVLVGLFLLPGSSVTDADRAAIARQLSRRGASEPVQVALLRRTVAAASPSKPDFMATLRLAAGKKLAAGTYALGIVARATTSARRTSSFLSSAFTVGTVAPAATALVDSVSWPNAPLLVAGGKIAVNVRVTRAAATALYIDRLDRCAVVPGGLRESFRLAYQSTARALRANVRARVNLTLPANLKPGVYKLRLKATDAQGVSQTVGGKGYVVQPVPATAAAPRVAVFAGPVETFPTGKPIALDFELCSLSPELSVAIAVRSGGPKGRVVQRLTAKPSIMTLGRRYFLAFTPKAGTKAGPYAYCVVLTDTAGRKSNEACGAFAIRRTE